MSNNNQSQKAQRKESAQKATEEPLGSKDNSMFIKHVYDESDHPVLAAPSTAGEELKGAAWAREEARCQTQNTIFNAERVAQAVLMGPHARVLLQGDPLDPAIKIDGKGQGAHMARLAYQFAKDYEREMQLILLEEMDKAEQEYIDNEAKKASEDGGQDGEGKGTMSGEDSAPAEEQAAG